MLVLLIEDDKETQDKINIAFNMIMSNYKCIIRNSIKNISKTVRDEHPDLILVDEDTIDTSGLKIFQKVKNLSNVPIIVLSSSKEEINEIRAVNVGADEYIRKPFNQLEFMARTRKLLRLKQWRKNKRV